MSTLYNTMSCLVAAGSGVARPATVTAIRAASMWVDLEPTCRAVALGRRVTVDEAGGRTTERFTLILERDIGHVSAVQLEFAPDELIRYEAANHERIGGSLTMTCERVVESGVLAP